MLFGRRVGGGSRAATVRDGRAEHGMHGSFTASEAYPVRLKARSKGWYIYLDLQHARWLVQHHASPVDPLPLWYLFSAKPARLCTSCP